MPFKIWGTCNHKWEVIKEAVIPSSVDQAKAHGMVVERAGADAFRKKIVLILACDKCGKLRRENIES